MKYAMELRTVQGVAFRNIMDSLKELVADTNITFAPDGISVSTMDGAHIALVHVELLGSEIEFYECTGTHVIGVSTTYFAMTIKNVTSHDTLVLRLDEGNLDRLHIHVINDDKNHRTEVAMKLLDIDEDHFEIPDQEYAFMARMSSAAFLRVCRDMGGCASSMQLYTSAKTNGLEMICKGQMGDIRYCQGSTSTEGENEEDEGKNSFVVQRHSTKTIQEEFNIKYLVHFSKATPLCNTVELFLDSDKPVMLRYKIGSMGAIRFCLAPQIRGDEDEDGDHEGKTSKGGEDMED